MDFFHHSKITMKGMAAIKMSIKCYDIFTGDPLARPDIDQQ